MAASIATSVTTAQTPGARRYSVIDFTPSTSYPALGEPLTAAMFGFASLDAVIPTGISATTTLHAVIDHTNSKLRIYTASTGAEVATASDQSANKLRLIGFGL